MTSLGWLSNQSQWHQNLKNQYKWEPENKKKILNLICFFRTLVGSSSFNISIWDSIWEHIATEINNGQRRCYSLHVPMFANMNHNGIHSAQFHFKYPVCSLKELITFIFTFVKLYSPLYLIIKPSPLPNQILPSWFHLY